jgi:hypothetical protein
MTGSPLPHDAPGGGTRDVLTVAAMTVALAAGGGIIAALCLGLATPAGVAAAVLADILACAAIALAVASYTTGYKYPGCPCLTASPQPGRRPAPGGRAAHSWEQDTLDERTWDRWEREVFGPPGPAQPPGRRPPPGKLTQVTAGAPHEHDWPPWLEPRHAGEHRDQD